MIERLITKLAAYFVAREGFIVEKYKSEEGLVLKDVFGYRYEIVVKSLGRVHDNRNYDDTKVHDLDFSEVIKTK